MAVAGLNSRTQSDSSPSLGVRIMEQHLHQPGLLARFVQVVERGSQSHVAIHFDTQCPGLPTDAGDGKLGLGWFRLGGTQDGGVA
ncbi:hypothetical protein L917_12584 [Phytophthora nicotianae]|uniref:Uncharacterized protein n=1 Tax=Phytophthora nicotianae TaxID=4792 RepID=W2KUR9_PHYNI|nr:hypothetical protein L917_12584 [Phytophthora nicotianae]